MKNTNAHTSRFDIAICNPPYKSNLHLKVLDIVLTHTLECVSVNPFACFESLTERTKLSEKMKKHIAKYELIDKEEAYAIFSIRVAFNLAIFKFAHNEVNAFEYKYEKLISIVDKLRKQVSWRSSFVHEHTTDYEFYCQGDGGFVKRWNMKPKELLTGKCNARLSFKTQEEKDNFWDSLECWPYKLMQIIDNGSAIPAHLPFMSDYTQPWTDERFKDYFNITDEEWKEIEETMSKYK